MSYEPTALPSSMPAKFAMTSFAHMFVDVPAPPWITSTAKCAWCSVEDVSASHACAIASATSRGSKPSRAFTIAAAFLTYARP